MFIIVLYVTIKLLKIPIGSIDRSKYDQLFLPLALFFSLGFVMAFIHELSHALWGTLVGGRVTYIQVAYLIIYPVLRITSNFVVGFVGIEGIEGFNRGVFLLGGSLSTNFVAWLLALIVLKTQIGSKTQLGLKILGLYGLLDLPFYVLFPQIGLQHWIFLGGRQPEPLIGARLIGIPDPAFYVFVASTTLGLSYLYLKPLINKLQELQSSINRNFFLLGWGWD